MSKHAPNLFCYNDKRDFAAIVKVMNLKIDYSGLSEWAQSNHMRSF